MVGEDGRRTNSPGTDNTTPIHISNSIITLGSIGRLRFDDFGVGMSLHDDMWTFLLALGEIPPMKQDCDAGEDDEDGYEEDHSVGLS
jgi:hypothetical protein